MHLAATEIEYGSRDVPFSTVITTADGLSRGRITGPSSVEFVSDHEVRGTGLEDCSGPFRCTLQYTLNLRTSDVRIEMIHNPNHVADNEP